MEILCGELNVGSLRLVLDVTARLFRLTIVYELMSDNSDIWINE